MSALPLLLASALGATDGGSTWSGFRNGANAPLRAEHLPLSWRAVGGVAWRVRLTGYGQSAPAVFGGRVFVTSVPGTKRQKAVVVCLGASDGRRVWQTELVASVQGDLHDMVSRAAPTPIVDRDGLYVMFESGDMARLSISDGKVLWKRALFREYGSYENGHGYGSSPAHNRHSIFVQVDHQGPSYLVAIEKRSGRTLWKTERPSRMSWTSPVVARQGGRDVVIVSSTGDVRGYDAASGQELWKFDGLSGNHIPSPTVDGDRLYLGAATPRGGRTTSGARTPAQSNCALNLIMRDGKPGVELLWEGRRALCEYGSPTAHRGLVYSVNPAGVAFCVDAETGEERWSERIGGPCWVSPIAVGDRIYFFTKRGATTVVKSGPRFEKLASSSLWSEGEGPLPEVDYTPPVRSGGANGASGRPTAAAGNAEDRGAADGPRGGAASYGPLDPCVYGVAVVDGAFFVRIGTDLFCVRTAGARQTSGR